MDVYHSLLKASLQLAGGCDGYSPGEGRGCRNQDRACPRHTSCENLKNELAES